MKIIDKIVAALFSDKKEAVLIESDFDYYDRVIKPKDDELKLFRSEKWSPEMTTVEVWYGSGDYLPLGPIEAKVISRNDKGELILKITDEHWLKETGWDFEFSCDEMRSDRYVRSDAYAWCYVGESGLQPTKWW